MKNKNNSCNFYKGNRAKIINQEIKILTDKTKFTIIFSFIIALLIQTVAYQKVYAQTINLPENLFSWKAKPDDTDSKFSRKVIFESNTQTIANQKKVRIIYLVPSDKNVREDYKTALTDAALEIQDFYQKELGNGFTFSLFSPVVEVYQTPHLASWYSTNAVRGADRSLWFYQNLINDGFTLSGGSFNDPNNRWIYFLDADAACDQTSVAGTSGIAFHGATVLRGLTMQAGLDPCPDGQPELGRRYRTIGGIAHEMGHAFNLPHPPGCGGSGPNQGCTGGAFAQNSLMWIGYFYYPNTYFLPEDKQILLNSGFFSQESSCTFSLSLASQSFTSAGGVSSVTVNTANGCAWSALSNNSWITVTARTAASGSEIVSYSVAANTGSARVGTITIAGQTYTISQSSGAGIQARKLFDFDGDGKSDVSVFRPSNGVWYLFNSQSGFSAAQFGISTDKIVPADYDGDGKTDIAVWRDGTWFMQRSSAGFASVQFGAPGDIPMPADFDGDGKAELAVYRPSNSTWYVLNLANNQFNAVQFGQSGDIPVAADYDGDGKADYAVYRSDNGVWYLLQSTNGFGAVQFGNSTDKPVVGDYDGDGKADKAVYRAAEGNWYLLKSTQGFTAIQFGVPSDIPAPADYDGDGKTDIAVFRPSNGVWYQMKSTQGFGTVQFGANGDKPISNAFIP